MMYMQLQSCHSTRTGSTAHQDMLSHRKYAYLLMDDCLVNCPIKTQIGATVLQQDLETGCVRSRVTTWRMTFKPIQVLCHEH